ncbi:sugar ABC transporter substrate-binding protein [Bacillus sp. IITD106]|nr:sugar ABC transporter substrate-binding protein [Bacillus sp. IITD106]
MELTFTYWGSPGEKKVIDEAIDRFEKLHTNISVKRMHIPNSDFQTKITSMVSSGNPPDLTYTNPEWAMPWAEEGMFLNTQELLEMDGLSREDFLDYSWYDYGENKSLGPIQAIVSTTLLYNIDSFEKAGLELPSADVNKAWTWDEFVDVSKTLTIDKNGNNGHSPEFDKDNILQYGVNFPTDWWAYFPIIASNNGDFLTEDGKGLGLLEPEAVEGLQAIADLYNVHYVAPDPGVAAVMPAPAVALQTQQVAMQVIGKWAMLDVGDADVNFGVAALPQFGDVYKTVAFGGVISIFADTKHPEEAYQLYKFINDPSSVLELHQSLWMPTPKKWYTDPELIEKWGAGSSKYHPEGFNEALLKPVLEDTVASPEHTIRNWGKIQSIIRPALDQAWSGDTTVEEALKDVEAEVKKYIEGRY